MSNFQLTKPQVERLERLKRQLVIMLADWTPFEIHLGLAALASADREATILEVFNQQHLDKQISDLEVKDFFEKNYAGF